MKLPNLIKRINNLWKLSEVTPEATHISFETGKGGKATFPIKKAQVISYKPRDPVKEITKQEINEDNSIR